MKKKMIAIGVACAFTAIGSGTVLAQDKAKPAAAPKAAVKDERQTTMHVENDKVRVTTTTYKPGSSSGMQERNARVVRGLSDGTLEKTYPDGKKETVQWKTGQVKYLPKETYSQKNVGKTDVVLYVVNLK